MFSFLQHDVSYLYKIFTLVLGLALPYDNLFQKHEPSGALSVNIPTITV